MKRPTNDTAHASRSLDLEWHELDRYFSGEASPDDAARLERLATTAEGAKLLRSMREIWDAAGVVPAPASPNVDAAWVSVSAQMDRDEVLDAHAHVGTAALPAAPRSTVTLMRSRRSRTWPVILAACAAAVVGAVGLERVIEKREAARRTVQPAYSEFVTRKAQRADIYLSDGTRVLLNVDSHLRVPASFGTSMREVTLDGEAYFEVVHDSTRPFRVRTRSGVAEDAGTVFVVARYPESNGMRVSVSSGVVVLKHESGTVALATLQRGDVAHQRDAGEVTVRHNADVESDVAWTQGKLVFDRVPLRDVVPRLARWFDADIQLGDRALEDIRYTASFRNEPVRQVLDLLAASLDAHVSRGTGSSYVLHTGKRNP